jgi:hypothetical protein
MRGQPRASHRCIRNYVGRNAGRAIRADEATRRGRRWSRRGINAVPPCGSETLPSPILAPLIALVLWSFVMWAWLYATRIPAVTTAKIVYDPHRPAEEFHAQLPAQVRWKADNYNNLMEQPTLFYAVALTLALLGEGGGLNTGLAWLYVGLRIAHSLVQALINVVMLRFAIFMAASFVLLAMSVRAALLVF